MPCYKPLDAYHAPGGISFRRSDSFGIPIKLPCGRCLGCKLEKAKQWALRIWHEASLYDSNEFITLTYAPEHLPSDHSLDHDHFQRFMKRLRARFPGRKIRYYMAGEYGEATEKNGFIARPHFHAIIFNFAFPEKQLVKIRNGNRCYTSPLLSDLWRYGSHEIGSVTFQSAGYCARYLLKKQGQECDHDGVLYGEKTPPYTRMSLRPGIGFDWYHRYKSDLFPHDYAVLPDGRQTPVPDYYRELLEREDPELAAALRSTRVEKARQNPDNSPDRLAVREHCKIKQTDRLKREL